MTFKESWQLASVKLAALVSVVVTALTAQPDLLLGIIAFIPADPVARAFMALTVGGAVFLTPVAARLWPQGITIPKDKGSE